MNETIKVLCEIIASNNEKLSSLNKAYLKALDTINYQQLKIAELELKIKYLER